MLLALFALLPCVAAGDISRPETWFEPSVSLTGSSGERFGATIACSGANAGNSYIAVGAPEYNNGEGRVYMYNAQDFSIPIQTIASSVPAQGNRFGAAVTFIRDINEDGKEDLLISEPKPNGAAATLRAYLTQPAGAPYSLCGTSDVSLMPGGGTEMLHLTRVGTTTNLSTSVVVGSPNLNSIYTVTVENSAGVCAFTDTGSYSAQGAASSLFGSALAELRSTSLLDSDIGVGAPNTNTGAGYVAVVPYTSPASDLALGTVEQRLGTTIAGNPYSGHFSFSIPNDNLLRLLRANGTGNYVPACDAVIPMSDMPLSASKGLRLLDSAFVSFLGGAGSDAAYATYRTEISTGGSVALVSTLSPGTCSDIRTFNNCVFDANQEQGQVIAGGSGCVRDTSGGPAPMLIVGSPGWNTSAGRIDIVFEGTQLASAKTCTAQAPTATPEVTATPQPTPTSVVETPIPVGSGTTGLPIPTIESVGSKSAVIVLPKVEAGQGFVAFLQRKLKISLAEASKLARSATLTYEVTLVPTSRASSAELSAMATRAKLQKLRSRKQRVTVSRLTPGTTYQVKWRVEIAIKKPKKSFFTKSSAPTSLTTSS